MLPAVAHLYLFLYFSCTNACFHDKIQVQELVLQLGYYQSRKDLETYALFGIMKNNFSINLYPAKRLLKII